MDARGEVALHLTTASERIEGEGSPQDQILTAIVRYLNVLDEDLLKLRKELQERTASHGD